MSCGAGCRRSSFLALLWPWPRPAAIVPIRPLAWEPTYALGAALEKAKRPKKKKKKKDKGSCETFQIKGEQYKCNISDHQIDIVLLEGKIYTDGRKYLSVLNVLITRLWLC